MAIDNSGEASSPKNKFRGNESGQDVSRFMARSRSTTLIVLGALKHGPGNDSAVIVSFLCSDNPMALSNIYRALYGLAKDGLAVRDGNSYRLTERGERLCPDKKQFETLMEAAHDLSNAKHRVTRDAREKTGQWVSGSKMPLSTIRVLGTIKHMQRNEAGDIVNYICWRLANPIAISNVYRSLKKLVTAGLLTRDGSRYSLTELGEQMCPDDKTFNEVLFAGRAINDIKYKTGK
jgi:DNA-binding IclR family transcriptional regulator